MDEEMRTRFTAVLFEHNQELASADGASGYAEGDDEGFYKRRDAHVLRREM